MVITRNTKIQGVCKNTAISELYSCGCSVSWPPLITRTVDVTENVACLLKKGTVYLSHCRDQATGLTTNGRQISRRTHRIFFSVFRCIQIVFGARCVSSWSRTGDYFAKVSRPKREANHQISYAADVNALVRTSVLTSISIALSSVFIRNICFPKNIVPASLYLVTHVELLMGFDISLKGLSPWDSKRYYAMEILSSPRNFIIYCWLTLWQYSLDI